MEKTFFPMVLQQHQSLSNEELLQIKGGNGKPPPPPEVIVTDDLADL